MFGHSVEKMGTFETTNKDKLSDRIRELNMFLSKLIRQHQVDRVVVEEFRQLRGAAPSSRVGMSYSAIVLAAELCEKPLVEIYPKDVRAALNIKKGSKENVTEAVCRKLPQVEVLKPKSKAKAQHAIDACAVVLAHLKSTSPEAVEPPRPYPQKPIKFL